MILHQPRNYLILFKNYEKISFRGSVFNIVIPWWYLVYRIISQTSCTSYLSYPVILIRKHIRSSKPLRIHPKFRSGGILVNLVFQSGQRLYQEVYQQISRNDPTPTLGPEWHFIDSEKNAGLPDDWGMTFIQCKITAMCLLGDRFPCWLIRWLNFPQTSGLFYQCKNIIFMELHHLMFLFVSSWCLAIKKITDETNNSIKDKLSYWYWCSDSM